MNALRGDDEEAVKLLLVDDRVEDLRTLALVLAHPGYEIVQARTGAEALRQVLAENFAVILLDLMLPGMDGFELARLVQSRERSRHTPMLFMTAAGGELSYIYRAYSSGAVDYLNKPIDPDVVRAKVAVFAQLFRNDRRIRRQAEALREAERRQRELELAELRRANERRYRNLAEAIPAIVWTARPDGALEYVNGAWQVYTGLGPERTRGLGWLAAVHPDDRAEVEAAWRAAVERRDVFTIECRLCARRGGEGRAHLLHAIPERDAAGQVVGWLGTMNDCEDLRQAIRARDRFLETASHELRAPLTSLSFAVHALGKALALEPESPLGDKLRAKVAVATRQMTRMERLIGALLDVTRISGGRPLLEPEPCDVSAVVAEVVERLRAEAERAGCGLTLDAPPGIVGDLDPLRVDQVITNLVANAIRYGVGQPIRVTVEAADGAVRIAVADGGPGIPEEELARLFGRFQRLGAESVHGGLGLGLYISQHLVRAHGGEISVASTVGQGTTFTVELPLEAARSSTLPVARRSGAS